MRFKIARQSTSLSRPLLITYPCKRCKIEFRECPLEISDAALSWARTGDPEGMSEARKESTPAFPEERNEGLKKMAGKP